MKTDSIFYKLFVKLPSLFFELIDRPDINPQAYRFDSVEVKQTGFRMDGIFVPVADSDLTVYFVEVQFYPDEQFYRRFFAEIFLYLRHHTDVERWQAVVIYPTRKLEPKDTLAYEVLLSSWQVRRIYLDELLASTPSSGVEDSLASTPSSGVEDSLGLKIMEFILEQEETAIASARNLIERVSREVASGQTEQEMLELIETVVLYKLTQFTREELQAMIYTETEFKQSRLYQSIKLEGIEEGKVEGKLEAVTRLLALGLSAEQVAGVLELTVEQVRQAAQSQSN